MKPQVRGRAQRLSASMEPAQWLPVLPGEGGEDAATTIKMTLGDKKAIFTILKTPSDEPKVLQIQLLWEYLEYV